MTQYLLSIYQPDGPTPPTDVLERIGRELQQIDADLRAAGSWVFTGGLHDPGSATVVRPRDSDVVMTDGPYLEGKEHIGGFWVITVADLDEALTWADRAARAIGLPIEVRPFRGQDDH